MEKKGRVLITGASRGLGRHAAFFLARHGFQVFAGARDPDMVARGRESGGEAANVHWLCLDVTDAETITDAVDRIRAEAGGLDALINNAGVTLRGFFEDCTEEEIRSVFETNFFGSIRVTRSVLPLLREQHRGRILFVTSIGGRIGAMGVSAYCASKFALEGFAESLMQELLPFGIGVSIIEPGVVKTDIWSTSRRVAVQAMEGASVNRDLFTRAEALANQLVATATVTPQDVSRVIFKAITSSAPRLRYVVGRRARAVLLLRRILPENLFVRLYFDEIVRRVSRGV